MTHFEMYLFTRLDNLCPALRITASSLIVALIALIVFYGMSKLNYDDGVAEKCLRGFKRTLLPAVVFVLFAVAVPTQKEAAAIYLVPKLVNNEQVQDIAGKSLDILTLKLNEWVADLTPSEKAE